MQNSRESVDLDIDAGPEGSVILDHGGAEKPGAQDVFLQVRLAIALDQGPGVADDLGVNHVDPG